MPKIDPYISITHARNTVKQGVQSFLEVINNGGQARAYALGGLKGFANAKACLALFENNDLNDFKRHSFNAAVLDCIYLHEAPLTWRGAFGHFLPLACDNTELIHWSSQYIGTTYSRHHSKLSRNQIGSLEYHAYQALLALQGKFDLLGERAEYILTHLPGKSMLKLQIDHEFYLGLARGSVSEMECALSKLISKKVASYRNFGDAFIFYEHLMSTFAFIYAKIAWRHGFEIQIESPYLPMDAIPIEPLQNYEFEYDFLKDYALFQPFKSEILRHLSPKPLGNFNVDICHQSRPLEKYQENIS